MKLVSNVSVWPATEVLRILIRIRILIRVPPHFDAVIVKPGAGINAKR